MSRILIIGGAGFIGANLVRFLGYRGRVIRVLDNLSAGRAQDLEKLPMEVIQGDICQPDDVARALADMDVVINLAAHMRTNVAGSLNLLQAAVDTRYQPYLL